MGIAILSGFTSATFPFTSAGGTLEPYTQIAEISIRECSGITKSRQSSDLYWVHNDSSGGSQLFAVRRNGSLAGTHPTRFPNVDWEDITTDNSGNLYIGDFGNFRNTRRDLAIHVLREPLTLESSPQIEGESYHFEYPDQTEFPPKRRIFDCEALFWAQGDLFLLTKSLGDTITRLYRFDPLQRNEVNRPKLIGEFDIGPRVTGADATPDGKRLAVLTTSSVWVFERPEASHNYLQGHARMMRIRAGQCEAICWDDEDTLIIANEDRAMFEVKASELLEY